MHDWKSVTVFEYYADLSAASYKNLPLYFICKKCGAKSKQYVTDISMNTRNFDSDNNYINNSENQFLTCDEIIIKNIIK